jgi:glutamyl endopeptidase
MRNEIAALIAVLALPAIALGDELSPSYVGAGRTLAAGEIDDGLASMSSRDTTRALSQLGGTGPAVGPSASIIGADQRRRVLPTTAFPARATVLITFRLGGRLFACSGFMIGKNTVATAGHCLAAGGSGKLNNRNTYTITPGSNGHAAPPYGSCRARKLHAAAQWLSSANTEYDYGAIKLDCNIGNTTGWYGLTKNGWQKNTTVTVQGYPLDKGEFTQWKAADRVRAFDARRVFHRADTYFGEDGAPLWFNKAANC